MFQKVFEKGKIISFKQIIFRIINDCPDNINFGFRMIFQRVQNGKNKRFHSIV